MLQFFLRARIIREARIFCRAGINNGLALTAMRDLKISMKSDYLALVRNPLQLKHFVVEDQIIAPIENCLQSFFYFARGCTQPRRAVRAPCHASECGSEDCCCPVREGSWDGVDYLDKRTAKPALRPLLPQSSWQTRILILGVPQLPELILRRIRA